MGAKGLFDRRLTKPQTLLRLEPLTIFQHETDRSIGHAEYLRGELYDIVEIALGRGVDNLVTVDCIPAMRRGQAKRTRYKTSCQILGLLTHTAPFRLGDLL